MFQQREIIDTSSSFSFLHDFFYMSKHISNHLAENLLFSYFEALIFYENYQLIDIKFFDEIDFAIKHNDCSYLDSLSESLVFQNQMSQFLNNYIPRESESHKLLSKFSQIFQVNVIETSPNQDGTNLKARIYGDYQVCIYIYTLNEIRYIMYPHNSWVAGLKNHFFGFTIAIENAAFMPCICLVKCTCSLIINRLVPQVNQNNHASPINPQLKPQLILKSQPTFKPKGPKIDEELILPEISKLCASCGKRMKIYTHACMCNLCQECSKIRFETKKCKICNSKDFKRKEQITKFENSNKNYLMIRCNICGRDSYSSDIIEIYKDTHKICKSCVEIHIGTCQYLGQLFGKAQKKNNKRK